MMDDMLVNEVVTRLRNVARTIPKVGHEDDEENIQDATQPPRHRTAILVLVEGGTMREAGKCCGIKDSAAHNLKRRIAADLIEFFGEDVIRRLLDGVKPGWESDLRTVRDRHLSLVANGTDQTRIAAR